MKHQFTRITVSIVKQQMSCYQGEALVQSYPVASAKNGVGQMMGSECTPLGQHRICEKIGSEALVNSVFVGRQFTGEIYSDELASKEPQRDWILSRILWLEGMEEGFNQGAREGGAALSCDTRQRYIYIHGCPDSHPMQIPSSHGCIKMRNADIIELYESVAVGTDVYIEE